MESEDAEVPSELDVPVGEWPHAAAAEVLNHAKEVARRIAERVRRATDDTRTDHGSLPADPTDEHPPVS